MKNFLCCLIFSSGKTLTFRTKIACLEGTIPGFTRIRNAKDFKNRLKQWIYTCRSLWIAGRRDSTLFGVVIYWSRVRSTLYLTSGRRRGS